MRKYFLLLICTLPLLFIACGEADKPVKKTSKKKEIKKESPTVKAEADEEEAVAPTLIPDEELAKAKEIIASVTEEAIDGVDAKKTYKLYCAACHGFKGDLNVNGAKDLKKSKISLEESVAQVYHGRGLMTPFNGIMEDVEIVAVAKWIETLRK